MCLRSIVAVGTAVSSMKPRVDRSIQKRGGSCPPVTETCSSRVICFFTVSSLSALPFRVHHRALTWAGRGGRQRRGGRWLRQHSLGQIRLRIREICLPTPLNTTSSPPRSLSRQYDLQNKLPEALQRCPNTL